MDTVGILTLSSAPEIPLAIGRNGFHRSPVDTSLVCFDFGGLQTKFFGSSGIVVAPTMFSNTSSCLRDNVEGNCKEHSLLSITSRSAASVSDLIRVRVRRSVAERDFAVYTKVLASFDISGVYLPSDAISSFYILLDLGFQINSYDISPHRKRMHPFYNRVKDLPRPRKCYTRALMDAIANNDFLVSSQVGTVAGSQFHGRYILFQLNCKLKRIFYSSASREAWENGKHGKTWHQDASEDRKKRWTSENCFETFPRSES
ncbi:hypothetical protein ALC56_14407 [Trachymyrmex septentrionalis]|uniref:Uncharacterized protein n=1 Tax=Trachymyrmex septentrionalis TaxID=34720 RepID=A0A195ETP0_9HYME|nr:hypothetical protein ALC56_14407 [Trachymyrmex septentrionalis]